MWLTLFNCVQIKFTIYCRYSLDLHVRAEIEEGEPKIVPLDAHNKIKSHSVHVLIKVWHICHYCRDIHLCQTSGRYSENAGIVVYQSVKHLTAVLIWAVKAVTSAIATFAHQDTITIHAIKHASGRVEIHHDILEWIICTQVISIDRPGAGAYKENH